ncbi:myogenesis-regulating glycosidase [Aplysia californica]|uniref:Myogenesis-regulating glycosidase n=1 Tax=Aplysia californica TaxID=6500 RepID=A0ABM1W3Z4_APLCA|nr:myogenesis-regulating glycosidase [Aplysia californica]
MENRDTITLKTSSLYRLAYTVPLCGCFLYFTSIMLFGPCVLNLQGVSVNEDLQISFTDSAGKVFLQGYSEFNFGENERAEYCTLQKNDGKSGCLEQPHKQRIEVVVEDSGAEGVSCYQVRREGLACVNQVVKDCYSLAGQHWYGGFEAFSQVWPLKKDVVQPPGVVTDETESQSLDSVQLSFGPYVSGDFGTQGVELENVLENLFFSSTGVGIMVSEESPLYLSFNAHGDQTMCLAATYDNANFFSTLGKPPVLEYTVCKAGNVKEIHSYMRQRFIPKPEGIPNVEVIKYPIWSTWAQYNKEINQSSVAEFADKIQKLKMPCSQIEIDNEWTVRYGDHDFDRKKFPDPKKMVADLNKKGYPVTLWIHPFFSLESESFQEAFQHGYAIMTRGSVNPSLVRWWSGEMAAILDVSNPAAVLWYQKKLISLQDKYNVSSFKFDAGEARYVPYAPNMFGHMTSTNEYATNYAELAYNIDPVNRRQEVRIGWRSQRLPIITRLMDRLSTWDEKAGLRSLIPSTLTLGVIGYPFVLPDMIGGNAYADLITFGRGANPDRELYIRWLQLSALLPVVQFSVVPWVYDDEVVTITKKCLAIREQYVSRILQLAQECVETGNPIIRPLWWVAPLDEQALVTGDEFLVGDDLLVAPIVVEGARKRDIYLPKGQWRDMLRKEAIDGPVFLRDYTVAIDELAHFERITS